jgi:hypothetical protein
MNGISSPPDVERTQPVPIADEVRAALERFAEETRETYVRKAKVWSLRLGIDEIDLAPEGAVHAAWVVLYERLAQGKIRPGLARDALDETFDLLLLHVFFDKRRGQRARRRDRSRVVQLSVLQGTGFDAIDENARPAEQRAGDEEQAHSLVDLLRGEGEWLHAIALLKMEGLTNQEIASKLGRPIWDVKRNLDKIRTILRPLLDDRG